MFVTNVMAVASLFAAAIATTTTTTTTPLSLFQVPPDPTVDEVLDLASLPIQPHYYRFSPSSEYIYQCPHPLNCKGVNVSNPGELRNGNKSSWGDLLCSDESEGPLCQTCKVGSNPYITLI